MAREELRIFFALITLSKDKKQWVYSCPRCGMQHKVSALPDEIKRKKVDPILKTSICVHEHLRGRVYLHIKPLTHKVVNTIIGLRAHLQDTNSA